MASKFECVYVCVCDNERERESVCVVVRETVCLCVFSDKRYLYNETELSTSKLETKKMFAITLKSCLLPSSSECKHCFFFF